MATVSYAGFEWARAIEAPDFDRPERFVTIGMSAFLRVLYVVHTEHTPAGRTRVISARKASATQRRRYEEG